MSNESGSTHRDSLDGDICSFLGGIKMYKKPRLTGPCIGDWCILVKDDPHGRLKIGDRVVIVDDSRFSDDEHEVKYGVYTDEKSCGPEYWFDRDLFRVECKYKEYRERLAGRTK